MKNKWKDAVEQAVKKDAPLRLEVGKKYRNGFGSIVTIIEEEEGGRFYRFRGDNRKWYGFDGSFGSGDGRDLVALVEDEPAKPEEPKKNPPLAVGQVWRTRSHEEATIFLVDGAGDHMVFHHASGVIYFVKDDGVAHYADKKYNLVEYLRETDGPRLEVGKKYRTAHGQIVTIVRKSDDGPFSSSTGARYHQFGLHKDNPIVNPIVELVEDEPAKAEEPKKNPPFAVGQVWRRRNGGEATIYHQDKDGDLRSFSGGGDRLGRIHEPDGTCFFGYTQCDLVEYLRETDRPRLDVGKKYRTQRGEITRVVEYDGSSCPFGADNKRFYSQFGFHVADDGIEQDHIVALVEEEPAKPEESKKNPLVAAGQIWRTFSGRKATIYLHKDSLFAVCDGGCWPVRADGKSRWDDAELDLVEYIGEANLDPKAEDVVQSKEIPLSEEATMSSKPQDRHESPQQDDRFTQYLIEECARLRDMLEQKDERIDELSRRLMETAQESICKQKIMLDGIIALQMDTERKRAADRESLKKDDINALRELCSSNFDAVFEELSNIKESNIETAGDVAAVGGMLAAMQERHECPAPVPATPTAPQEDSLDKGLKLTNRTLTAAQIIWKIIQFTIAFSLFGGAATCAVMMLK